MGRERRDSILLVYHNSSNVKSFLMLWVQYPYLTGKLMIIKSHKINNSARTVILDGYPGNYCFTYRTIKFYMFF